MVVLGCSPDHAGTADVDFLHGLLQGELAGDGAGKVVEVDADQINGDDVHLLQGLEVLGEILVAQDAAVDFRVQGLDAAAQDFREARHVAHLLDGEACGLQGLHGAARGDELHAVFREEAGELGEAGLVGDAQDGASDGK